MTDVITIPGLDAPGLVHGFSTAALGSMRQGEEEMTAERAAFAARLGLDAGLLSIAGAVHGDRIERVDAPRLTVRGADGLASDRAGLPLLATFADCYPVIVYDPRRRAVVLAHSGWRGTAAAISEKAVATLVREYGSRPDDLVAGIGPGICGRCYEVGAGVAERFPPGVARPAEAGGKFLLDLAALIRRQLVRAGVREDRLHLSGACTMESQELFSHRRRADGMRFAGIVAIG